MRVQFAFRERGVFSGCCGTPPDEARITSVKPFDMSMNGRLDGLDGGGYPGSKETREYPDPRPTERKYLSR